MYSATLTDRDADGNLTSTSTFSPPPDAGFRAQATAQPSDVVYVKTTESLQLILGTST